MVKSFMKAKIAWGDIDDGVRQSSLISNLDCFIDNNVNDSEGFMEYFSPEILKLFYSNTEDKNLDGYLDV